jgi:polysaccharide export outer membrane protein
MTARIVFVLIAVIAASTLSFAQDGPTPSQAKGYRMWPGDEVTGKVLGETDFDFVATVSEDGTITIPFDRQPIVAKCRTEDEVKADISKLLSKYLRNPLFNFRVTDRKSRPPATISGEVAAPQQVILYRKATLIELLAAAGDVKEEASGSIKIYRTQPPMCDEDKQNIWTADAGSPDGVPSRTFNVRDVKTGRSEFNPVIYPGDNIIVQRALPVYVTGEVLNPQGVLIKDGGLTVYQAVAKLGGPREKAKTKDIKIYRQKPGATFEVLSANFDLIKKGQQKDIQLEPYDVIEVSKAKDSVLTSLMKIALGAGKSTINAATGGIGYRIMY